MYKYILSFLIGCLVSYISLQFQLFELNYEIDVPNFLLSIIGIVVGIYIARTIQDTLNKEQNKVSYLTNKVDDVWSFFGRFSTTLLSSKSVTSEQLQDFNSEVLYRVDDFSHKFSIWELDIKSVNDLYATLEAIEEFIGNSEANENVVVYNKIPMKLKKLIDDADNGFMKIMKEIS